MKNLKILTVTVLCLFCFCGCVTMSKAEKSKERQLVKAHTKAFKLASEQTYGENAELSNIHSVTHLSGAIFEYSAYATPVLQAMVKLGETTFQARYDTESGNLTSTRNYEKIASSAQSFFESMGFSIVDFEFDWDNSEDKFYPDYIDTYEEFINANGIADTRIFTTDDLSKLTESDFDEYAKLSTGQKFIINPSELKQTGVSFYSLSDISLLEEIKNSFDLKIVIGSDEEKEFLKKYKINNYLHIFYSVNQQKCFLDLI